MRKYLAGPVLVVTTAVLAVFGYGGASNVPPNNLWRLD